MRCVMVSRQLSLGTICSLPSVRIACAMCAPLGYLRHIVAHSTVGDSADGSRTEHRCFYNARNAFTWAGYQDMGKGSATISTYGMLP